MAGLSQKQFRDAGLEKLLLDRLICYVLGEGNYLLWIQNRLSLVTE